MTDNTNSTFDRAALEKQMGQFGEMAAKGANSRPMAAVRACKAAHELTDIGSADAEVLWELFQRGMAKVKGVEYKKEGSFKTQVSKFKPFLALGELQEVDGPAVLERAVTIIREYAAMGDENPLKGSAYDNMLVVARRQCDQPDEELDDEAIRGILTPEVKEKTALDKLIATYKAAKKLHDTVPSKHLEDAIYSLEDCIKEQGGEVPDTSPKGKKLAALMKQAEALGLQVNLKQRPAPAPEGDPAPAPVTSEGTEEAA